MEHSGNQQQNNPNSNTSDHQLRQSQLIRRPNVLRQQIVNLNRRIPASLLHPPVLQRIPNRFQWSNQPRPTTPITGQRRPISRNRLQVIREVSDESSESQESYEVPQTISDDSSEEQSNDFIVTESEESVSNMIPRTVGVSGTTEDLRGTVNLRELALGQQASPVASESEDLDRQILFDQRQSRRFPPFGSITSSSASSSSDFTERFLQPNVGDEFNPGRRVITSDQSRLFSGGSNSTLTTSLNPPLQRQPTFRESARLLNQSRRNAIINQPPGSFLNRIQSRTNLFRRRNNLMQMLQDSRQELSVMQRRARRLREMWNDPLSQEQRAELVQSDDPESSYELQMNDPLLMNQSEEDEDFDVEENSEDEEDVEFVFNRMGSASGHASRIIESDPEIVIDDQGRRRQVNMLSNDSMVEYDSDWSELEDFIYEKEECPHHNQQSDQSSSDESQEKQMKRQFIFGVLQSYGSFAALLALRVFSIEKSKLSKDPLFGDISIDLQASQLSINAEVDHFLSEVFQKVQINLENVSNMHKYKTDQKVLKLLLPDRIKHSFKVLKRVLDILPNEKQLKRCIDKSTKNLDILNASKPDATNRQTRHLIRQHMVKQNKIIKELTLLKVMLDLLISTLINTESPIFKRLALKTLPLALKLHKETMSTQTTELINKELKEEPYLQFLAKHPRVFGGFIIHQQTRKGYINFYQKMQDDYKERYRSLAKKGKSNKLRTIV